MLALSGIQKYDPRREKHAPTHLTMKGAVSLGRWGVLQRAAQSMAGAIFVGDQPGKDAMRSQFKSKGQRVVVMLMRRQKARWKV